MILRKGHPIHLRRHTFEVKWVGTKEFGGLRKDVVNVMPLDSAAVDLVADNPGDTLCVVARPPIWILDSCSL